MIMKNKKYIRNRIRTKATKTIVAGALLTTSLTSSIVMSSPQKAEASSIYTWEKYSSKELLGPITPIWGTNANINMTYEKMYYDHEEALSTDYKYSSSNNGWGLYNKVTISQLPQGSEVFIAISENTPNILYGFNKDHYPLYNNGIIAKAELSYTLTHSGSPDSKVYKNIQPLISLDTPVIGYEKGDLQRTLQGGENDYINNQRNSDGFWYVRKKKVNNVPSQPTFNSIKPTLEHGDTETISWSKSTDADNDPITYTLEVSYDNKQIWTELTQTSSRFFDYTVPSDKTSVVFRVRASDGKLDTAWSESTDSTIQEVQYYWSKFNTKLILDPYNTWSWQDAYHTAGLHVGGYSGVTLGSNGYLEGIGEYKLMSNADIGETLYFFTANNAPDISRYTRTETEALRHYITVSDVKNNHMNIETKSSLVSNTIKAGFNAYTNNVKHTDGFWYERGQRTALLDSTPPVIELTEQSNYAPTSKVTVKTHDLSPVSKVKYAKGNHQADYFATGGTNITTEFTETSNGEYTVYAEDSYGNKTVQVINVTKVNTPPTTPSLQALGKVLEHGETEQISWTTSNDIDGNTLTYQLEASYDNEATWGSLVTTPDKKFDYVVPADKSSVKFRVRAFDGQEYSSYSPVSEEVTIQEVQYYWNKYSIVNAVLGSDAWQWNYEQIFNKSEAYALGSPNVTFNTSDNKFVASGLTQDTTNLSEGEFLYHTGGNYVTKYVSIGYTILQYRANKEDVSYQENKEALITNDIKAGFNAYTNNAKHTDGFWYERGQRSALPDTTPPLIELSEQINYDVNSKVEVKATDISGVKTIKYAEGIKDKEYFNSGGTVITDSFTTNTNGTYTVYAVDELGNDTVQTIEVRKVNNTPVINKVSTDSTFNIVDSKSEFNLTVDATDLDGQILNSTTTYGNNQTATSSNLQLTLKGSAYSKGVTVAPITVKVNDGIVDSADFTLDNHIIIKVDDVDDYERLLTAHTSDAKPFAKEQHQVFHNAYEAVLNYEKDTNKVNYDLAIAAILEVKQSTAISQSDTITEWTERIEIINTTLQLTKAETSLDEEDYEKTLSLYAALTLQSNKDLLEDRIDELIAYHNASDSLVSMETEVARHKSDSTSVLDSTIINTTNLNNAKVLINLAKDTTQANYKTELNKRLLEIQNYNLNNKEDLSPGDIENVPEVDADLTTEYDEIKDAFKPIAENVEHLVKYTNALVSFMNNVDELSKDEYVAVVSGLPRDTGIDFSELDKVTEAVKGLYNYRSSFKEDQAVLSTLETIIKDISIGGINTIGYFEEIRKSMKEVTEYNDVAIDTSHDNVEKQEASIQLQKLKTNTKFLLNMEEYLANGIPDVIISDNPYEYIVKDEVVIKGTVADVDHVVHVVTAELGADKALTTTTTGYFSITIPRNEGVYLGETLTVNASDSLTNKTITVNGKPIISVSDPTVFTEMVKLLEIDRAEAFNTMSSANLEELLVVFNKMISATANTSSSELRSLYLQAENLSTQSEGKLELYVKSKVGLNYLEWLYQNYQTATIEDFELAGVTDITVENIDALKKVIDDYKQSSLVSTIPTATDYTTWITMLASLPALDTAIDAIYGLTDLTKVNEEITKADAATTQSIPEWSSIKSTYTLKLEDVRDYAKALESVITAEMQYTKSSYDSAVILVEAVKDSNARTVLENRLVLVKEVLDAITSVELAENTKDEKDINDAQTLVNNLVDGVKKNELQDRLNSLFGYDNARKAVVKAETELSQTVHDNAKTIVDTLPDSSSKANFLERLEEVQRIITAISAVAKAENSGADQDILDAQTSVDLILTQSIKTDLQNRLNDIRNYSDAVKAVVEAERDLTQASKDSAYILVDKLPTSCSRDRLFDRLDDVQRIINGTQLVEQAKLTKDKSDVINAELVVNTILNTVEKEKLQERLDRIKEYNNAKDAVTDAENSNSQVDKDKAEDLVDKLPDGPDKEDLKDRLEDVQDSIDNKTQEEKAKDDVVKAEDSWDSGDINDATDSVNGLPDSTTKDELLDRIDKVKELHDAYEKVKVAVEKAELSKLEIDASDAKTLLDTLVTLIGQTNSKTDSLQVRLDEVNNYILAEKATTLAEGSKYQRHIDEAQRLINKLQLGADRDDLQERLDKVINDSSGVKDEFLDRIINGNPPVTEQELADYTKQPVYKEIFEDYLNDLRDLSDKTGTVTKEDVIQVVKVVNALEFAKRSMDYADINLYDNELALLNPAIQANYPIPEIMYATELYLVDDSTQMDLATALAELLNKDVNEVLEEMKKIIDNMAEVSSGSYSVNYIDESTKQLLSGKTIGADFGIINFTPQAPEGYELTSADTVSFELNEETDGKVLAFYVKSIEDREDIETPEETGPGSYTVSYLTSDNAVVHHQEFNNVILGIHEIKANPIEGYEIASQEETTKVIELTEDSLIKDVIFFVEKVESTVRDPHPNQDLPLTEVEELQSQQVPTLQFASTMEQDSEIVESTRVASLDNSYLTSTQVTSTPGTVEHKLYLTQAAEASVMISGYKTNPTQKNLDATFNYVTGSILDGAYKAELLQFLKKTSEEIGEDGKPDLTPVTPETPPGNGGNVGTTPPIKPTPIEPPITKPTPIEPPVTNPKPIDPLPEVKPPVTDPGANLPPIYVTHPPFVADKPKVESDVPLTVLTPPKDGSTTASEEIVGEGSVNRDGDITWFIENPLNREFELKSSGMNISIKLDKDTISKSKKLKIQWKHLGKDNYRLLVYSNGKRVQAFDAKAELVNEKGFTYMHINSGGEYKAMPYTLKNGSFKFKLKSSGVYHFTKQKKSFKDVTSKMNNADSIEELAGRHVVKGSSPNQFKPNAKLTRAQFSAMLTRSLGLQSSNKTTPFKDTKGQWNEKEIQALYEAGIIRGTSSTTFNPNGNVTRQQAVDMLYAILRNAEKAGTLTTVDGKLPSATKSSFKDQDKIADGSKKAVAVFEELNLLKDFKGNFQPNTKLTRAELSGLLVGVLRLSGDM